MKFFDLEIDNFLSAVNSRKGGRSVSYAEGTNCAYYKYTHGSNYAECAKDHWNQPNMVNCKEVYTEPIQK